MEIWESSSVAWKPCSRTPGESSGWSFEILVGEAARILWVEPRKFCRWSPGSLADGDLGVKLRSLEPLWECPGESRLKRFKP
jgi:hypothetical protein